MLKTYYLNIGADKLPPQPTKGAFVDQATEFVNAGQASLVMDSDAPESLNTLFYLTKGRHLNTPPIFPAKLASRHIPDGALLMGRRRKRL